MNRCCRDAKSYLADSSEISSEELKSFIDEFNIKIENYSSNGLSSYLLNCVELSLRLSESIGYKKGEVVTRWLKGHALFLGGKYKLAEKSYISALALLEIDNPIYGAICSSYALNMAYIGDFSRSLELMERLIEGGEKRWVAYTLSVILKFREERVLSGTLLQREMATSNYDQFCRVDRLLEINNLTDAKDQLKAISESDLIENDFFHAYSDTLRALIKVKDGGVVTDDVVEDILIKLNSKSSFYHYIDGLLNIAELYLTSGDLIRSVHLLELIISEKRELVVLDCRLYRLMESCYQKLGDDDKLQVSKDRLDSLSRCCSSQDVDQKLDKMTSMLNRELALN